MGTDIRPETSKKSKYYISKHRYYELLHWCRQYDEWIDKRNSLYSTIRKHGLDSIATSHQSNSSYIEGIIDDILKLDTKINTLTQKAFQADESLCKYIIFSVTKGRGYTYLREVADIPCCKNTFYEVYRRFFYLLDKELK